MSVMTSDVRVAHAEVVPGETRRPRRGRVRRAFIGAALSVGIVAAGATAAYATRVSAGGGTWDYGVTSLTASYNWSDYYHGSRSHGSSVTGDDGLDRSPCRSRGTWSYSSAWDSNPFRVDKAYWRYC
ncbi:lactococcin 972 family bacteriocin [Cellulosimicrobium protaetiae]|uniref:Lactococcin 972 family bacteriocin n=1 Tax=Cellulosimicrobium protaetiae TaxID=2587808 RepID=A0A6M5UBP3_9MICO|nr:lactococcin 972 family bacteriocin [Cellulosimicrobium protaetiae]QJW35926.1 lactococcin 972 family bacteriocin [Cellulosimicrobium protaetiae]